MLKGRRLSRGVAVVVSLALFAGVAAVVPDGAQAREVKVSFSPAGPVETGVGSDPADCLAPLNIVPVEVLLFIINPVAPVDAALDVELSSGWQLIPDSCAANVGVCQIVDASNLTWSGTLSPQVPLADIDFVAQVDPDVPVGTELCATFTAQFGTETPITETACLVVNARQCGVGAPTVSYSTLAVLVALLFTTGVFLIRRRA